MTDAHDREIATMFDRIAARYDFLNRVLSFGTDRGWRRRAIARADIRPGMAVLDVGAGTGDLSFAAAALGARIIAIDLSAGMLAVLRNAPVTVRRRTVRRTSVPAGRSGIRLPWLVHSSRFTGCWSTISTIESDSAP